MKKIQIEWCENFIITRFKKLPKGITGIETNCFFKMAEKAGLYIPGTYGTPISQALERLTDVKDVYDDNGSYSYSVFILKNN